MNFSAETVSGKWACRIFFRGATTMARARAALLLCCAILSCPIPPAEARSARRADNPWSDLFRDTRPSRRASRPPVLASVPLPQPRPADAPGAPAAAPDKPAETPAGAPGVATEPSKSAAEEPSPRPPSACRLALTDQVAIAPSIPDITGPGSCGGEDLVRLEAVVLPDASRVAVKPAAILRCTMATAIADWIRTDMAPLAVDLNTRLSELDNFDSFDCRGRNRVSGAKMSEHGRANALDVRGLKFANGQTLSLTDRAAPRDSRVRVLQSLCSRFSTVLGPGSDGYHEDHIHLDIVVRRSGYRICQWEIYEPMPAIAPLLPAERPAEAPPRDVAEGKAAPPGDKEPEPPAKAQQAAPEAAPEPVKPATKSRRHRARTL